MGTETGPEDIGRGPESVPDPKAVLEVCLCHNIRRAARSVGRRYDAALRRSGLTAGQFAILAAVAAYEPLSTSDLRTILAMDRTALLRTLKPLKNEGYVEGPPGAGRRAGLLQLTADGARVLRQAAALWQSAQAEISGSLGTGRAGQILASLSTLTRLTDIK